MFLIALWFETEGRPQRKYPLSLTISATIALAKIQVLLISKEKTMRHFTRITVEARADWSAEHDYYLYGTPKHREIGSWQKIPD